MASTFKTLLNDDVVNTRTLLHEAIPITGTIVGDGTEAGSTYSELNIKTYTHGMFESTYDYPYLSSSANHIFDVTYGYNSSLSGSTTTHTQNAKKLSIYNQFAQVLMGYKAGDGTTSTTIRNFDSDGTSDDGAGVMNSCLFLTFSRLLVKDEIKKGSFTLQLHASGSVDDINDASIDSSAALTLGDYGALNQYRTSPAGDYGLVFARSTDAPGHADEDANANNTKSVGLIFYQAGILVLSSSVFQGATTFGYSGSSETVNWGDGSGTGKGSETAAYDKTAALDYSATGVVAYTDHPYSDDDVIYVHSDDAEPGDTGYPDGHYQVSDKTDDTFKLHAWTEAVPGTWSAAAAAVVPTELGTLVIAGWGDAMGGLQPNGTTAVSNHALISGTIENLAKGFRNRWVDCDFQNTIELNSTVYFARINHNEFNYSSNPTFVAGSKLVVKKTLDDLPVTYLTTIGLYSPDNELLAVAKLSEPLRKDPNTELTLRVRLDY